MDRGHAALVDLDALDQVDRDIGEARPAARHLQRNPIDEDADLLVRDGLDLILEIVGLVDERLDPLQLTVVRIDEPGKETEH